MRRRPQPSRACFAGARRRLPRLPIHRPAPAVASCVPLLAASVHYWRLEPVFWRPAIAAVRDMGFRFVDTYIPWSVHEQSDGSFDFGAEKPELDVALFFRIVEELGLLGIARPGPHINAELTTFGIPERVIWDSACQARGPSGEPVVLPFIPGMFPVPSYASSAFFTEVERYFDALVPVLAPLCAPNGPVAMVQIDNEGAFYFRDGVYDQDYHPDAIARYRAFLRERFETDEALREGYASADSELTLDTVSPPTTMDARERRHLRRHLDWAAFQEQLIADAIRRFATALTQAGMPRVPTLHNFPMAEGATPLNPALVGSSVDLIGYDYYHRARASDLQRIGRRTSELAVRCDGKELPSFAPEMGVGFPPYFPPLSEDDSAFTLLAALAYGLRGYNLYMAVERDRWIGAPVGQRGHRRPAAAFYEKVNAALERVGWFDLRRNTPVRVVVPRAEQRLARVLHAFGPVSGALLGALGLGPREGAMELDLGLDASAAVAADTFVAALEQALNARGVPFAVVGGEEPEIALRGAKWIIVATSGGFSDALARELEAAIARGVKVTVGPAERQFDERFCALSRPWDAAVEQLRRTDPRTVDELVGRNVEGLDIELLACDTDGLFVTVHVDEAGAARVAFVINTTGSELVARVTLDAKGDTWEDVLDAERFRTDDRVLDVRLKAHSVRMLSRVTE